MKSIFGLAAGLVMLAWSASASAECAWVLWMQIGQDQARAIGGYETKQVCQDAVRKAFADADFQRIFPDDKLLEILGGQTWVGKKGDVSTTYTCLPDTVDPRGPKGK